MWDRQLNCRHSRNIVSLQEIAAAL
jgi:hypothetical protein